MKIEKNCLTIVLINPKNYCWIVLNVLIMSPQTILLLKQIETLTAQTCGKSVAIITYDSSRKLVLWCFNPECQNLW